MKIFIMVIIISCYNNLNYNLKGRVSNEFIIHLLDDPNEKFFKDVLSKIENINAIMENGSTLLHAAVLKNAESKISILLELGANPLIQDKDGKYAVDITEDINIKKLIQKYEIRKEIEIAIQNKELDILKILLLKVDENELCSIIKNIKLSIEVIECLVESKYTIVISNVIDSTNDRLLLEKIKKFIEKEAINNNYISSLDKKLEKIIQKEELKLSSFALANNINLKDVKANNKLLKKALYLKNKDIIEILLNKIEKEDVSSLFGNILTDIVQKGDIDLLKYLLDYINESIYNLEEIIINKNLLHLAIKSFEVAKKPVYLEIIKTLMLNKCDLFDGNNFKINLNIILNSKNKDLINFIDSNLDNLLNLDKIKDHSPLHICLEIFEDDNNPLILKIIKFLVDKNVNLMEKNKYQITALKMILTSKNHSLLDVIKEKINSADLNGLHLVKKYIDKYIDEAHHFDFETTREIKINYLDYCYLLGSFLEASEDYLKNKENAIKNIITILFFKNFKYSILHINDELWKKDRNVEIFSGCEMINLQYWEAIVKNDIVVKYWNMENLSKSKLYFLDKIRRIDEEALGIATEDRKLFKHQETAKYVKIQLQKLFKIINHYEENEDYMNKLTYTVNTLLESVNYCSTKILSDINHCISFCLNNVLDIDLKSCLKIKILQVKEEMSDRITKECLKENISLNYSIELKMFIEKELGILPKEIVDSNFSRRDMSQLLGNNLGKIIKEFRKTFDEEFIEEILKEKSIKDKVMEYFDINIGNIFMGDINSIIYSEEGNIKKETLVALLYLNNFIELFEE